MFQLPHRRCPRPAGGNLVRSKRDASGLVFAYNVALQFLQIGRWRDCLHGERAYMLPSLIAKTLLAWQVWSGTVRPWERPVQSRSMNATTATARIHDRQLPA